MMVRMPVVVIMMVVLMVVMMVVMMVVTAMITALMKAMRQRDCHTSRCSETMLMPHVGKCVMLQHPKDPMPLQGL